MAKDIPFYMREVDENTPVMPTESETAGGQAGVEKVDIGSIQTTPGIDYASYKAIGKGLESAARVTDDGRIVISLNLKKDLPGLPKDYALDVKEFAVDKSEPIQSPALNVVIMIVGSRGDVQPYVALGKRLIAYGHRVRLATHETFRSFVTDEGLEFFNIGGDPHELMSYMVKNPGLIPGFESLTNGDIKKKKKMVAEMLDGCWRACLEKDSSSGKSFAADAIIANPPSFAHIHCAEALGIPVQLSFTMPWSPTTDFSHPLVQFGDSNVNKGLGNYLSYALADLLTWQGLGDVINRFRSKTLGLEPLSLRSGPLITDRVKIPWTYCMSPSLVPKPQDWKNHIDIVGFYFLDQGDKFQPPEELANFLKGGEEPIYIGFGSVVVDDAAAMTKTIFEAVEKAGVRALVSAGWGGLGGIEVPSSVFILKTAVPHDWLFSRVFAVCHHGGAGTTAIGLRMGKPTIIVPFFGDQPWWGRQVATQGAGPEPIPAKKLEVDNLSEAIRFTRQPETQSAAQRMGEEIRKEDGIENGLDSFHRHLPLLNMRCDLDPSRVAVWWSTEHCLRLSAFAAQTLSDAKRIDMNKLDLHRTKEYDVHRRVTDPITGGAGAIFWTVTHYYGGIAKIFYSPVNGVIETTTAIPRGIMSIVASVHEGFHNAPKLYGSSVREPGEIKGFSSGLKEGGKGLFYGYYDGITGLVTEPVAGAKKEGFIGAVKGSLRSFANVTMRPAAGAVGLVAHPASGAWKSVQKVWARNQLKDQRSTRISDGVAPVNVASSTDKEGILKRFEEAMKTLPERKKKYKETAEAILRQDSVDDLQTDRSTNDSEQSQSVNTDREAPPSQIDWEEAFAKDTEQATRLSMASPDNGRSGGDEDAFEKDLAMAKQLSLAEYSGYERGLAHAAAKAEES